MCVQVCVQAAEKNKSENLFTGKKLFQRGFFLPPPSSPISRCWGNRHPRAPSADSPAWSSAARIAP